MKLEIDPKKALTVSLTALVLLFAVWLVSPYFTIDKSDADAGKITSYRLFIGLTIMIGFVGKSLLAPQGLAKRVSSAKAVAIVALAIVLTGFIIFTIARATAYYLDASIATDSANFLP
jgi:hypothetical protein